MSLQAHILHWLGRWLGKLLHRRQLSIPTYRRLMRWLFGAPKGWIERRFSCKIAHDSLAAVSCEWIRPDHSASKTILYFHGGGYVIGSPVEYRRMLARIAQLTTAEIFCPEYRLAPEYPCPAPVEDGVASYLALLSQGQGPESLFVGGDSAGGGIALATLMRLRDLGHPLPRGAFLISPWVDLELAAPSLMHNAASDFIITRSLLESWAQTYLSGQSAQTRDASPVQGAFHGLPPLLVQAGTGEILFDDAAAIVGRAQQAGVSVTFDVWRHMPHCWQNLAHVLPEGRNALVRIASFLNATGSTPIADGDIKPAEDMTAA